MPLTTDGQNSAADGVSGDYTWLALFNGDPEGAGTELTGGSPAYARKQVTWNASSGGQITGSGSPVATFDVPAGADVSHWALYTASSAGTRGVSDAFGATESFGSQGTFNVNTLTLDPLAS